MSAEQVIAEFKGLSPAERAQVAKFVVENYDSWIPEEFKQGVSGRISRGLVNVGDCNQELLRILV